MPLPTEGWGRYYHQNNALIGFGITEAGDVDQRFDRKYPDSRSSIHERSSGGYDMVMQR